MRAWRPEDAGDLASSADDERVLAWMSDVWPEHYTLEDARWWIEEGQFSSGMAWALCLEDRPKGGVGLHPQRGFLRCNVELGWWLNPAYWGNGIVPEAGSHLLRAAWALADCARVFAPIHAGNVRSERAAEKMGMTLESVQRLSAFKRGRLIDRHIYVKLNPALQPSLAGTPAASGRLFAATSEPMSPSDPALTDL